MAYSTITDIEELIPADDLIQITDDDDTGSIDSARVDAAILDADAEIDGYCGERYVLPFDPVPEIIKKLSVDISIYNLYSRREAAPEIRIERYKMAVKTLDKISSGKVSLGADGPEGTGTSDAAELSPNNPGRLFSRSKLSGW